MSEKCKGKNEKHAISLSPLSNIMVEVEKNELDPAELIIKKNNLTAFERRVNETQEELRKVFTRVEKIYGEYEESRKLYSSKIATLELLHDIQELENILQDEVKNKKYHQQLTVFIVSYSEISKEKLELIQQLNEFFLKSIKKLEAVDFSEPIEEPDLDKMSQSVEEALATATELIEQLDNVNNNMLEYVSHIASSKSNSKGKKKLGKSLQEAKSDIIKLKGSLQKLKLELEEKEFKTRLLYKEIDEKNKECKTLKEAVEKANICDSLALQDTIVEKNQLITELRQKITHLETWTLLPVGMDHADECKESKAGSKSGSQKNNGTSKKGKTTVIKTKGKGKSKSKASVKSKGQKESEGFKKSLTQVESQLSDGATSKTLIQGGSSKPGKTAKSEAGSIHDFSMDPSDSFDLADSNAWSNVTHDQLSFRFAQYRKLSTKKLQELEEQLKTVTARTQRKVQSVKAQFQDHKNKWDTERALLEEQILQLQKQQHIAKKEVYSTMGQLEDFISEQEQMGMKEDEEFHGLVRDARKLIEVKGNIMSRYSCKTKSSAETEEEKLERLMQQTDDAKVKELTSRHSVTEAHFDCVCSGTQSMNYHFTHCKSTIMSITSLLGEGERVAEVMLVQPGDEKNQVSQSQQSDMMKTFFNKDQVTAKLPQMQRFFAVYQPNQDKNVWEGESIYYQVNKLSRDVITKADDSEATPAEDMEKNVCRQQSADRRDASLQESAAVELMKIYNVVISFKENLMQLMLDNDMMSASQVLTDLETLTFDKQNEKSGDLQYKNIVPFTQKLLKEVTTFIGNSIATQSEPHVSSTWLLPSWSHQSKDYSCLELSQSQFREDQLLDSRLMQDELKDKEISFTSDKSSLNELASKQLFELNERLKLQFDQETKRNEEKLRPNTVTLIKMQNKIMELQKELCLLKNGESSLQQEVEPHPLESAVMFTRLDSERNNKILKKAVCEQRLEPEKYQIIASKMEEYVNLPAQRFVRLVYKYYHQRRMNAIRGYIKKYQKKEYSIQNVSPRSMTNQSNELGAERQQLAMDLTANLEEVEEQAGLFLIKPLYSYHERANKSKHPLKKTNFGVVPFPGLDKQGTNIMTPGSSFKVGNSASGLQEYKDYSQQEEQESLHSKGLQPGPMWVPASLLGQDLLSSQLLHTPNTPRILELDINRMLVGQNNVSAEIKTLPSGKLPSTVQSNLHSYVAVTRPTVPPGQSCLRSPEDIKMAAGANEIEASKTLGKSLLPPLILSRQQTFSKDGPVWSQ